MRQTDNNGNASGQECRRVGGGGGAVGSGLCGVKAALMTVAGGILLIVRALLFGASYDAHWDQAMGRPPTGDSDCTLPQQVAQITFVLLALNTATYLYYSCARAPPNVNGLNGHDGPSRYDTCRRFVLLLVIMTVFVLAILLLVLLDAFDRFGVVGVAASSRDHCQLPGPGKASDLLAHVTSMAYLGLALELILSGLGHYFAFDRTERLYFQRILSSAPLPADEI